MLYQKGQKNVEKIQQAIDEGAKTYSEISVKTGLSYDKVKYYFGEGYLEPFKERLPLAERKSQLEELVKSSQCLEEIADKMGLRYEYCYKLGLIFGIKLPDFKNNRYSYRNPERDKNRDELIRMGLSLGQIRCAEGKKVTRERIRQYIIGTGQHETWKKSREHYEQAKN